MRRIAACALAVLFIGPLCPGPAWSENAGSLGYSEETVILPSQEDDCSDGVLIYNHDGSFENGYSWHFGGIEPPYYGAFGEGYDLGAGSTVCGVFWFAQMGSYEDIPLDIYIWEGGVSDTPGDVLVMIPGIVPGNVPNWPSCGQNDVEISCCVTDEFTVGYWGDFSALPHQLFICVDESGPDRHPWTCVAPDIGYPTGWQHTGVVWGDMTISMGIGVYFDESPSPTSSPTWGTIKSLFQ
jgi:hypothetical protein